MFVFTSSDYSGTNHAVVPLVGCRWHDVVYHYLQLWYRRWFIVSGKLYYWSKNVSCWNDKSGIFVFLRQRKEGGELPYIYLFITKSEFFLLFEIIHFQNSLWVSGLLRLFHELQNQKEAYSKKDSYPLCNAMSVHPY